MESIDDLDKSEYFQRMVTEDLGQRDPTMLRWLMSLYSSDQNRTSINLSNQ
jgi:hypothetical protein